jgi:hypothetical protein
MKLQKLSGNMYRIHTENTKLDLEFTLARQVLIHAFDFEETEIDAAIVDMTAKGNDLAHFGINRYFIFSEAIDEKDYGLKGTA